MKLELKHLAGYLPYGLKVFRENKSVPSDAFVIKGATKENVFLSENGLVVVDIDRIKPILRPLSGLTKEIEVNGEKFVPIERLRKEYSGFYFESNPELLIKSKNTNLYVSLNWTNEFQQKLYEWHFDIYGLIEKNLAIDKNIIL